MGLDQVKDLTHRTMARIIKERPFKSLDDFLTRADPRPIEAVNLIRVGALDGLGSAIAMLERVQHSKWLPGQPSLFSMIEGESRVEAALEVRVQAQEEILGISVDVHPLELVADRLANANVITTVDAANRIGEKVRVAGIRQSWHRSRTAHNETMTFISLEDLEGVLDVVVFPNVFRQYRNILSEAVPILIEGQVLIESNQVEPTLHAEKIWKL
jgi:DNA polymerase-3 subunit alpha